MPLLPLNSQNGYSVSLLRLTPGGVGQPAVNTITSQRHVITMIGMFILGDLQAKLFLVTLCR